MGELGSSCSGRLFMPDAVREGDMGGSPGCGHGRHAASQSWHARPGRSASAASARPSLLSPSANALSAVARCARWFRRQSPRSHLDTRELLEEILARLGQRRALQHSSAAHKHVSGAHGGRGRGAVRAYGRMRASGVRSDHLSILSARLPPAGTAKNQNSLSLCRHAATCSARLARAPVDAGATVGSQRIALRVAGELRGRRRAVQSEAHPLKWELAQELATRNVADRDAVASHLRMPRPRVR